MSYFPMFIELENTKCLVVGGGEVALRKAQVMALFCHEVIVIAPCISEGFDVLNVIKKGKVFEEEDLDGIGIVIAASDNREVNHQVSLLAQKRNIPVNAVDQKEDCTFIFPSFIKEGDVIAAFSSSGSSPVLTQYLKRKNEDLVTPLLGEINDFLGSVRETVIMTVDKEKRKACFKELLYTCIEKNEVIDGDTFARIMRKYE